MAESIKGTILTTCPFPGFKTGNMKYEAIKKRFHSDSYTDKNR